MTDTNPSDRFCFPKAQGIDFNALESLPTIWIKSEDELYALIDEIDNTDVVALDTEFIKRTTYFPILALVQVNTGKAIYLVDAPRLDLTEFWQALAEVPTMVWYACGEDLGIFYLLAKNPPLTNIFDVQIGIAYLTGKLQAGYSLAVQEVLGVSLDKGESQSDWLVRPLSETQEIYAVNDVRYLLALYDAVKNNLIQNGVLDFVQEDCLHYAKELHVAQNLSDDELYLDFVAPNYTRQQLAVLKSISAWRESLARSINEPRSFIIGKQALREIIEQMPTSIKELSRTTTNRGTIRRYGEEMVRLIKEAKNQPESNLPPLPAPTYTSKTKPFKKPLDKAIEDFSETVNVPSNLLLKGRWISQILHLVYQDLPFDSLPAELQGYRREWIKDTIIPLLQTYKPEIQEGFLCSGH